MITEIGIVAGEIWHALDQRGERTCEELCRTLERAPEVVLMSLGWLCREGHVQLVQQDEDYHVSLTRQPGVQQGTGR